MKNYKIAVAGTGYVGLSLAVLLSQKNEVTAVDIVPEKVEKLNKRISPIQDKEIEEYLATKDLNLRATTDGVNAYKDAEFVIIAAPTNYDPQKNFFDTSAVESVIELCGNVYTTFYAYLYDFGVTGVIVLMILMGLISQVLYQKATKPSKRNRRYSINLWIIVYSYVFYSLAFSFFSNKFYEGIVSIQFIKYLVFWAMVRYFVERTKFKAVSFKRI